MWQGVSDAFRKFKEAHTNADTDNEPKSIHHTLGKGPNQAAQGNHSHTTWADDANPPKRPSKGDEWIVEDKGNISRRWNGKQWIDNILGVVRTALTGKRVEIEGTRVSFFSGDPNEVNPGYIEADVSFDNQGRIRIYVPTMTDGLGNNSSLAYIDLSSDKAGNTAGVPSSISFSGFKQISAATADVSVKSIAGQDVWRDVVYKNSWKNYSSSAFQVSYRKLPDGTVIFKGTMDGGANGTVAFTLPVGYRPPAQMTLITIANTSAGVGAGRVDVMTNGDVTVYTTLAASGGWIAMPSLRFTTLT